VLIWYEEMAEEEQELSTECPWPDVINMFENISHDNIYYSSLHYVRHISILNPK